MSITRDKIENTLLEIGVPVGMRGFIYIADAVEYMCDSGIDVSTMKEVYPFISKKRDATVSSIERTIRYALRRSREARCVATDKYIGEKDRGSANSMKRMCVVLRAEGD